MSHSCQSRGKARSPNAGLRKSPPREYAGTQHLQQRVPWSDDGMAHMLSVTRMSSSLAIKLTMLPGSHARTPAGSPHSPCPPTTQGRALWHAIGRVAFKPTSKLVTCLSTAARDNRKGWPKKVFFSHLSSSLSLLCIDTFVEIHAQTPPWASLTPRTSRCPARLPLFDANGTRDCDKGLPSARRGCR